MTILSVVIRATYSFGGEHELDQGGHASPVLGLDLELPPAGRGQPIELRAPVVLGDLPRRTNPPAVFQPHERGVQRPLVQQQRLVRHPADALGDAVPVHRTEGVERLQNEQVEGALEHVG